MPKVSTFPSASTPLANADVLYAIQGGNSRKATVADIFTAPAFDTEIETKFGVTGTAPVFACRAWVNFNGTGVVAIRASGNVSSITDSGTGDYTINFTTAMPDANYAVNVTAGGFSASVASLSASPALATGSVRVFCFASGTTTATDASYVTAAIFR